MKRIATVLVSLFSLVVFSATNATSEESGEKYTASFIHDHSPITGRNFFDYLRRLGIPEEEVLSAKGQRWLSVGEGKSDFTAEAARRGVDSHALDALVLNPHAPERSRLGLAQSLPFNDGNFDRVIAVWLMDLFFSPQHFNDPKTGRAAIQEMIRVTRVGGDIRISPVKEAGLLQTLEELKTKGMIQYEVLPYFEGHFKANGKKRLFTLEPVKTAETGSVRITRLK